MVVFEPIDPEPPTASAPLLAFWPWTFLGGSASPPKRPVRSMDLNPGTSLELDPPSRELNLLNTSSLAFLLLASAAFSAANKLSGPMRAVKPPAIPVLPVLDEKKLTVGSLPLARVVISSDLLSLSGACHPGVVCCNPLEWKVWGSRSVGRGGKDSEGEGAGDPNSWERESICNCAAVGSDHAFVVKSFAGVVAESAFVPSIPVAFDGFLVQSNEGRLQSEPSDRSSGRLADPFAESDDVLKFDNLLDDDDKN